MEATTPNRCLKAGSKQQTYKFVTTLKRDRVGSFCGTKILYAKNVTQHVGKHATINMCCVTLLANKEPKNRQKWQNSSTKVTDREACVWKVVEVATRGEAEKHW